jgi:hypothetical protein
MFGRSSILFFQDCLAPSTLPAHITTTTKTPLYTYIMTTEYSKQDKEFDSATGGFISESVGC